MNNQLRILVGLLLMAVMVAPALAADGELTLAYVSPTPVDNAVFNWTTTFSANLTSNETIKPSGTGGSYLEWINQSGTGRNVSLSIYNDTETATNYTDVTVTGMDQGTHTYRFLIVSNLSGVSNQTAFRTIEINLNTPLTLAYASPTFVSYKNLSSTTFIANVTSNETIKPSLTGGSYLEWINGSGVGENLTLVVYNDTEATTNYTEVNVTGLADGNHRYRFLITSNDTGYKNQTAFRNITIDTTAPTISISAPTSGTEYIVNETGTLTVTLTYVITEATTRADVCKYDIYDIDSYGGVVVYNTTNTTIANCANSTIMPSSGDVRVKVWANDSAGNQGSGSIDFKYRVTSVGGGGSGGGGAGPTTTTPGIPIGVPSGDQGAIIGFIVLAVIVYFLWKKKK